MAAFMRFQREHTHRIDDNVRKTWPMGWQGEVDNDDAAFSGRKSGAGEFIGPDAEKQEEAFKERLAAEEKAAKAPAAPAKPLPENVAIPDGWQDLKAPELIDLARKLGASGDVKTKDDAAAFVGKVAEDRKQASLV